MKAWGPRTQAGLVALALAVLAGLTTVAAYQILPLSSDWMWSYQPGALSLLAGQSPYHGTFVNPAWVLIPLIPLALLPAQLGRAVFFTFSLACLAFTSIRLKARPLGLAAILLSYPVLTGLAYGQIDPLLSIGLVLPPQWGLLLVLAKPQTGAAVAVYWAVEAYAAGGWKKLGVTFAPVTAGYALNIALWGNWFASSQFQIDQHANVSLFPWLAPVGLSLMLVALRRKDLHWAIGAAPMFSPYVAMHSWENLLLGAAPSTALALAVMALSWGVWIVRTVVLHAGP